MSPIHWRIQPVFPAARCQVAATRADQVQASYQQGVGVNRSTRGPSSIAKVVDPALMTASGLGLSQDDLAAEVGLDRTAITSTSRWSDCSLIR